MSYNVKPGDRAIIVDSVNGKAGLSVGRRVLVHANAPDKGSFDEQYAEKHNMLNDPRHYCPPTPYEKEHTRLGKIWPVTCLEGKPFATNMGHLVQFVDVPDQFLRKLPDEPPSVESEEETKELDTL